MVVLRRRSILANNNDTIHLTEEMVEYMYKVFGENYELLRSKDRTQKTAKDQINNQIMKETGIKATGLRDYWRVYWHFEENIKLNSAEIGPEIFKGFLKKIEEERPRDYLVQCLMHCYEYLTVTHKGKPRIPVRSVCQEFADRISLELNFYDTVPLEKIKKYWEYSNISSEEDDETTTVEDLNYEYRPEEMICTEAAPPRMLQIGLNEDSTGDNSNSGKKIINADNPEQAAKKEKNKKIKGYYGEELVCNIERKMLKKLGILDEDHVPNHIAKKKDGYGYDITSYRKSDDGKIYPIYIEVKTTSGKKETPFFISEKEIQASEEYGDKYYLYRIYNLDVKSKDVYYYVLNGNMRKKLKLTSHIYVVSWK